MTLAMTELDTSFKSTSQNLNNSLAVVRIVTVTEDESIPGLYRFLKSQSPAEYASVNLVLPAPSLGLTGGSLLALLPNRLSFAKVSSKESAADALPPATPDAVQAFFQPAERYLSAKTEVTAQYALKLLRRIRELVGKICPINQSGRVLALVDKEDGSTTIEWIRNRSRLGFVLDRENESSWFIVLPNGLSKSGYLYRDSGLKSLRELLEEFIAAGE